ncbi:SMP-30/gluconolactonase/LRE family protein [Pseudomonas aeruginosa]|uniref:SMP-30/gluconolactonase/LRE family protein n=1 Tax=Pseudomonas aeruginosa TaxID=287 RepID=UPI00234266DE|nr:SMP-30/gluconolactonase/LRE family protein [Pseudomonas aeruginosa]MDC3991896.1 SMP-30/gluconolactonase/LRE family protein [Pseudomonas aeruginosa]
MQIQFTCVVDCSNELGECPLWSPTENVLWWIDVANPALWRFNPSTNRSDNWPLPKPPTVIALRENGGLLIVFRRGYALIDSLEPGAVIDQQHQLELGDERFNDGKVDRMGRMWVGTMDRKLTRPIGQLYRFNIGHDMEAVDQGFVLSNGIGWSPDATTMYFAETHSKSVYAFDYALHTGAVTNRRVFARIENEGGPDGLTVDSAGNVWVAVFGGGAIYKFSPCGRLLDRLITPIAHPTSCTFGGTDLQTLYITSSRMSLEGQESTDSKYSGGVWAVRINDHRGQPENLLSV